MKFRNKGAVLVQIAPLFVSQPRIQNQSTWKRREMRMHAWKHIRRNYNMQIEKHDTATNLRIFFGGP